MSTPNELDLFLLTFNCGKKLIDEDAFTSKLSKALPKKLASLYVFGLEEFCDIMDGSFELTSNRQLIAFNQTMLKLLSGFYGTGFHTIDMVHVGAIGLVVLTPFPSQILKVRHATSSCGYFYSSMKGAAGSRITFRPMSGPGDSVDLTFACAHLSAYEGEYYTAKRNHQVIRLMRSLDFGDGHSFLKPGSHSFFMGDLNYRTVKNAKAETAVIEELASLHDQTITSTPTIEDMVQKYDELSASIRNDEVFMGFTEPCINFQPTYKYHVGNAIYNTKRAPSWCDRILYQSTYNNKHIQNKGAKQLPKVHEYNSLQNIFSSDHQPVYLSITIPFKAPESIISESGYLKILPNDQIIDHFHRTPSVGVVDTSSGPTQIYAKSTVPDRIIGYWITPFVDSVIGNSLWLSTTSNGRLTVLLAALLAGSIYLFLN